MKNGQRINTTNIRYRYRRGVPPLGIIDLLVVHCRRDGVFFDDPRNNFLYGIFKYTFLNAGILFQQNLYET